MVEVLIERFEMEVLPITHILRLRTFCSCSMIRGIGGCVGERDRKSGIKGIGQTRLWPAGGRRAGCRRAGCRR